MTNSQITVYQLDFSSSANPKLEPILSTSSSIYGRIRYAQVFKDQRLGIFLIENTLVFFEYATEETDYLLRSGSANGKKATAYTGYSSFSLVGLSYDLKSKSLVIIDSNAKFHRVTPKIEYIDASKTRFSKLSTENTKPDWWDTQLGVN